MDLQIDGRIALVTGADSGIGYATAAELLSEGAIVVLTSRDADALERAGHELARSGGQIHALAADLRDTAAVAALREQVHQDVGQVDIVVHSAGVTGPQGKFHELSEQAWQDTLDIDLLGAVRVLREFLPDLRRGWGRVVLIASEDGTQPYDDELPYSSAKAGLLALGKGLSRSYASEGLLVNTVSPAFIATPMTDAMMDTRAARLGTGRAEAISSFLAEERPFMELGRRGDAEEVAAVITFLCSQRASFVNGANYRVDAGSVATL